MAINKITKATGEVLLDLSSDTFNSSDQLINGVTGHLRNGTAVTGTLVIQRYYTGSTVPSASLGSDGDIYLQT